MRLWEFDDHRAIPTNLVLEQDFILRIRRLHRMATPHLVVNLLLSEIPADYSGRGTIDDVQRRLSSFADSQNGSFAPMTNGDVFITWPQSPQAKVFAQQALMVALPNGALPEDFDKYVAIYTLPQDYATLRERANAYIDMSKTTAPQDDENSPARLLQSDAARGPLTAWSVNQIERLAGEIDLCAFIRSQPVYELQRDKSWNPLFDESFMGLEEIRQAYFKHLDVTQPKHLFLDLCQVLDRALLTILAQNYESIASLNLSLNLSLPTILGKEFATFTRRIPRAARKKIGFEIHCGDLIQDFTQTLSSLTTLRQEGFRISIDGVTPDMLGFINFGRFDIDFIKVNVAKDRAIMLKYQAIRQAIMQSPREKIVFFHCDSEQALAAGADMGITKFQGWLIDGQARKWRKE